MERYRTVSQLDDGSLNEGDTGFLGMNSYDTLDSLEPGQVQAAVNMDFSTQTANTRGGFVCLPELGLSSFNVASPWTSETAPYDKIWAGVAYGNGRFVAVAVTSAGSNDVMYSVDGITWTGVSSGIANGWQCLTFGGGLFVAVASTGSSGQRVATSPDGVSWTIRSTPANNIWRSVTYGNGLFVAVSYDGTSQVMTSPDGITWTGRTSTSGTWTGVTYGNGLYVAVGDSGSNRVMTSPDGVTWTGNSGLVDNWQCIAYGAGTYVAASSANAANTVMTSTDGTTWTRRTTQGTKWLGIAYGNGLFVLVGSNGTTTTSVNTSPDGGTWTSNAAPTTQQWNSVTNGNNTFVAVPSATGSAKVMIKSFVTSPSSPGTVLASGVYSDPNDAGSQWVMLVGTTKVGFYAFGRSSRSISYASGQTVSGQSTIVQCNNQVYLFRGASQTPLYWDGNWNGSFSVVPTNATLPPGFGYIPNSNQATYYQNRLWVVNGKDTLAASDVLSFQQYDQIANAFNLNTGSSDYLVTTYPFGTTTLLVFKNKSIIALTNIQGSLSNVVATEITRQVGCIGINAVVSVGSDVVYMSDRNINLISLTDTNNALQHQALPLSRNIQSIIQRVNWKYAYKVSMAYWDNKLYVALPLDNATSCSSIVVYNFVTQQWFGEWNFASSIAMCIQGWAIVNYLGSTKLHAVTEDGRLFVFEGGQNDISGTTVAEISTSLTTRAYRLDNNLIKPRRLYADLQTNRPNYSITAYADGASEYGTEISNQTYSRANSWVFNDSAYDLTNANNDYNRPYRQDYSTGPNNIQCGTGFLPEMQQSFRLPLITRRKGRLAWFQITNTTGTIGINGIGIEATPSNRGNYTAAL